MSIYRDDPAPGGITFAAQGSLPKLPIPDLRHTCMRYLAVLRPLQSAKEHAKTQRAVEEFLAHEGPPLHQKLKQYASDKTSYIEQFWYDSYLNFDNPVVLNLNPFFLLEDDPTPARNNQVTRAASLVVSALEFVRAVRKEELPPDTIRGKPLCMYQYSRLFGTARVPTESGCHVEQDPSSRHMVVLAHGQFYWFDVLDTNSDLIMTEKDISVNLQTIINDAAQTPIQEAARAAVGVLSTESRKVWSGLREVLTAEPGSNNADCLEIVDSALFVLCLDYTSPADVEAVSQNMLCGTSEVEKGVQTGTCTNRWYDKLQIIVCRNGSAGINFEHTGVDGHTVLRFASDVYTDTILRFARTINGKAPTLWASTSPDPSRRDPSTFGDVNPTPRKLEWDLGPELRVAVRFAEIRLADLIGQNEFRCLEFSPYGKLFITSMGFSPDAFVQMAFQAAYYGLYGRAECSYEPALTKFYLHGRTEAIRPVTADSVRFVQTFWGENGAEKKVEALREACQRHVDTTRECAKGEGCDRHLYALLSVWQKHTEKEEKEKEKVQEKEQEQEKEKGQEKENGQAPVLPLPSSTPASQPDGTEPIRCHDRSHSHRSHAVAALPAIFADPGWNRLNTIILSTSNCGNPSLRHFGFGPTSGAGFGIGYIIKDGSLSICVSSRHRQTKRFVDALESYLLEIRRMLRLTAKKTTGAAAATAAARESTPAGGITRAREVDEGGDEKRPRPRPRLRPRGRLLTGISAAAEGGQPRSAAGTTEIEEDEEELGGYGFFDAGMLLQALKARDDDDDDDDDDDEDDEVAKPSAVQARRREVGKKLRLIDY